jgi:POT family proton-dependent oligopeptide transporter
LAALLLLPIMALIVKFNEFEHYLIWLVSIVILFGFSSNSMNEEAQVPMIFLVMGVFVFTIGELFLSPVGLSKVTELSPKKFVSFLMGVWFLASFYGDFFAGKIAQLTTVSEGQESVFTQGIFKNITPRITGIDYSSLANSSESHLQLYSYVSVFAGIGLITMCIGIIAIIISPIVKKKMGGIH